MEKLFVQKLELLIYQIIRCFEINCHIKIVNKKLIGVIGIQKVKNVILIRHAYTLSSHQGKGIGSKLVEYLLRKNQNVRLLVGTWEKATWAVQFYEKFGFILHSKEKTIILLKKYWNISSKQIENSVVLERY